MYRIIYSKYWEGLSLELQVLWSLLEKETKNEVMYFKGLFILGYTLRWNVDTIIISGMVCLYFSIHDLAGRQSPFHFPVRVRGRWTVLKYETLQYSLDTQVWHSCLNFELLNVFQEVLTLYCSCLLQAKSDFDPEEGKDRSFTVLCWAQLGCSAL